MSKIDPRKLATVAFVGFGVILWMRSNFNTQADFRTILVPTVLQGAAMGLDGAMVQMVSHGLVSGALFLCVGVMYARLHSREISAYGGVINEVAGVNRVALDISSKPPGTIEWE